MLLFFALISYSPYALPAWVPFSRQAGGDSNPGNFVGPFGTLLAGSCYFLFGVASYLIPVALLWLGGRSFQGNRPSGWKTVGLVAAFVVSGACLADFQSIFFQDWIVNYNLPRSEGGFAGYVFGQLMMLPVIGHLGASLVMGLVYASSVILLAGVKLNEFVGMTKEEVVHLGKKVSGWQHDMVPNLATAGVSTPATPIQGQRKKNAVSKKPTMSAPKAVAPIMPVTEPKIVDSNQKRAKVSGPTRPEYLANSATTRTATKRLYQLPSLNLLEEPQPMDELVDRNELLRIQRVIVDTLRTFRIEVTPGDITCGPAITRYEIYPSMGLSVKKIVSLEADLARATRAERITILAPIPGKDTVGIEIANESQVAVPLRELLEDPQFYDGKAHLPVALGKDVYGETRIADLAAMPHLLVAGATGSGKSVCINSLIASLLYRYSPEELRFIMVDPKVVEMQHFNVLPHMAAPVVTEPKKVLSVLRWCLNEMERRYGLFAAEGCRKLEEYNRKIGSQSAEVHQSPVEVFGGDDQIFMPRSAIESNAAEPPQNLGTPTATEVEKLPFIVIIIDELADLMQTAGAEVETAIARLCQKARAAGLHLVVATQSPRADVVTGLIKANIPARIAFQVSSATDSRVILDKSGAEKLVGKGDLLFQPPDSAVHLRAQGAFVTDEELRRLVDHCASQGQPVFDAEIEATISADNDPNSNSQMTPADEETLNRCIDLVMTERKASTSFLQRRLRLGYTRAARMMDLLEERGIVGPGDGAKPREILTNESDRHFHSP